jgi:hypothetical protein
MAPPPMHAHFHRIPAEKQNVTQIYYAIFYKIDSVSSRFINIFIRNTQLSIKNVW